MLTEEADATATLLDDAGDADSLPSGEGFAELAEYADSLEPGDDTTDEASADTPLPGDDAGLEDSRAPKEESDAADADDPAGEEKAEGDDGKNDEGKSPAPEKHGSKTARFESHFENAGKPITEITSYLQSRNPERFAELERAVIDSRLEDPVAFGAELYGRDKERFGRVATTFFQGHPEYYAQALVSDPAATPEQVRQAWEAFKSNPSGGQHAGGDGTAGDAAVISEEEIAELRYWDADVAAKVEGLLKAKAPEAKPTEEAKPEPKEDEAPKPDPEAVAAEERAVAETLEAGYTEVKGFLDAKADDPAELGLSVTDAEREKAPALAEAKDYKRDLLFRGKPGVLPDFEAGLFEWAKDRSGFREAIDAWGAAARRKDSAASIAAARRIRPFAEKYLEVRLKHDAFARADKLIEAAAAAAKRRPAPPDKDTPGSGNGDSQRRKAPAEQSIVDFALELD